MWRSRSGQDVPMAYHLASTLGRCFQLMQILQVQVDNYIPKWQIFVEQEETAQKQVVHWLSPTTIWEGCPVLGFMAETYLRDLSTVGSKHFNPMWSFPSTSVQNWDPTTFGMPAYHLIDDASCGEDVLVGQSPIVVFKAATVLQALGIIHSRIILPSSDLKGEKKNKTYSPSMHEGLKRTQSGFAPRLVPNAEPFCTS